MIDEGVNIILMNDIDLSNVFSENKASKDIPKERTIEISHRWDVQTKEWIPECKKERTYSVQE